MNKLLVVLLVFCSVAAGVTGICFLSQPEESWDVLKYKRHRYTDPVGAVHDETDATPVTIKDGLHDPGLGLCILSGFFLLSGSVLSLRKKETNSV